MKSAFSNRSLRKAMFVGMALLGGLVSQAHAQLSGSGQQLGAQSQAGGAANPIAFANKAGALWTRHWSGSAWFWANHGNPAPADSISFAIGSSTWYYANSNQRWPFAWMVGANNVLYSRDYGFSTGAAWTWVNHGYVGSVLPVGSTNGYYPSVGNRPHAFFINSSGSLFSRDWTGSVWQSTDHGYPPGTSGNVRGIGTLAVASGNNQFPYAFVIANDGNLWNRRWDGSSWLWENLGAPASGVAASLGTSVISSGTRPFVFVKGNDNNMYSRSWNGSAWVWTNHGTPSGLSISSSLGATCSSNCGIAYNFVTASDGNVWSLETSGSTGTWFNHGTPSSAGIAGAVGATAVSNTRPYLFVVGSDGNLWVRWWSGSAWGWSNQGAP